MMSIALAETIVSTLAIYFGVGALVALFVVTIGAARIDPAAKGMPVQARAIIFPGAAILWPLMAWKLITQTEPPVS